MHKLLLILLLVTLSIFGGETETIGIFEFENSSELENFKNFNSLLFEKVNSDIKKDKFEINLWNLNFKDVFENDSSRKANCRIAIFGRFEKGKDNIEKLTFKVLDMKTGVEDEKSIQLDSLEKEDVAQIIILKLHHFLEKSLLGILKISSLPLGCTINLNNKNVGVTPKEFFLKGGKYNIELTRKRLLPYRGDIILESGSIKTFNANMEFSGYKTKWWLIGTAIFTVETILIWVIENSAYKNHENSYSQSMSNSYYSEYKNFHYLRVSLLGVAGIGWIGSGFSYFSNKITQKRLFKK